ncbi:mechanosensitive ion channel domain-containing protein [uncultured Roseobacter sp.]|uniref:mechanosensitive ion channel domain-containing protein n=1 Tax=uncultured Roseobacter sp. TaxID=114847 RepID=UPI0026243690|nr:mechanosensitive ion channel domain-containing protein [uncultured Roseobacter sp.]
MRLALFAFAFFTMFVSGMAFAQEADPVAEAQQLIDLLENDSAREALIASLREVAAATEAAPEAEERVSFGRQIARLTSGFVETAAGSFASALAGITSVTSTLGSLDADQIATLADALIALAVVFVATTISYIVLRYFAKRVSRSMGERAHDWDFLRTLAVAIATTLMDAFVVILAWGLGYLAALYLHGDSGTIGVRQSLYLNAFLLVGLAKVLFRAVLSPSTDELRFVSISDAASKHMSFWLGSIATVIGYGQLLIVPIVNRQASFSAGRGISTLLAFVAIIMSLMLVLRNRRDVAAWFLGENPEEKPSVIRFAARNWYVPVVLYLLGLAIIVAARPDGLIWPVLLTTGQVIAVITLGLLASGGLSRFGSRGLGLPEVLSSRMPSLEGRVNALFVRILGIIRVVISICVLGFALDFAGIIDFSGLLQSDFGTWAVGTGVSVGLILLFGFLAWLTLVSWVDYRLNPEYGSMPTSREKTLLTLLRNAATIVLMVIISMFALSEMGIDIAPLIASAGVLGLAIGFGAQKLVQDIITGVFIQFENAINVGDVVTLGSTTGTAEKLTIRSITLRDVNGTVHLIPFSSVDMVSNYVKDFSYYVCDLGIAYRENIDDGREAMQEAFQQLRAGENGEFIEGDLEWFGVQALGDSAVVLRARIKCAPGKQWGIGRAYNELCKRVLDARGIEIPYPHQTIYFGESKDGSAPALHLKDERGT